MYQRLGRKLGADEVSVAGRRNWSRHVRIELGGAIRIDAACVACQIRDVGGAAVADGQYDIEIACRLRHLRTLRRGEGDHGLGWRGGENGRGDAAARRVEKSLIRSRIVTCRRRVRGTLSEYCDGLPEP